jgi:ribosome-associated protein
MARRRNTGPADGPPSRSQKKRDAAALTALGERLTGLPEETLTRMDLPEEVREAVRFARTLKIGGARKRQIQRVGKLLREIDAAPLREAMASLDRVKDGEARRFHRVESWRDAIVRGDDAVLQSLSDRMPDDLRPELERLSADAQQEHARGAPRGAGRALFRFLMKRVPA